VAGADGFGRAAGAGEIACTSLTAVFGNVITGDSADAPAGDNNRANSPMTLVKR